MTTTRGSGAAPPSLAQSITGDTSTDGTEPGALCDAKIRPFPNPAEVMCERDDPPHDEHRCTLRDYAYPGSETVLTWQESDRRTYRGLYIPCGDNDFPCVLPQNHRGRHQQ